MSASARRRPGAGSGDPAFDPYTRKQIGPQITPAWSWLFWPGSLYVLLAAAIFVASSIMFGAPRAWDLLTGAVSPSEVSVTATKAWPWRPLVYATDAWVLAISGYLLVPALIGSVVGAFVAERQARVTRRE
jgi:hypothetical protein